MKCWHNWILSWENTNSFPLWEIPVNQQMALWKPQREIREVNEYHPPEKPFIKLPTPGPLLSSSERKMTLTSKYQRRNMEKWWPKNQGLKKKHDSVESQDAAHFLLWGRSYHQSRDKGWEPTGQPAPRRLCSDTGSSQGRDELATSRLYSTKARKGLRSHF